MKTPLNLECQAHCEIRLNELDNVDLANLTEFAERQLAAKGLNPMAGEDATQRALMAILRGLESDQGGRVPRLMDTQNKQSFLNFVRGAISSVIEGMSRKRRSPIEHEPWEKKFENWGDPDAVTAEKIAEINDLKDQLFPRLRQLAPPHLHATIDAWELVFAESDRVPSPGHRRYAREVKHLARQIVRDLGGIR